MLRGSSVLEGEVDKVTLSAPGISPGMAYSYGGPVFLPSVNDTSVSVQRKGMKLLKGALAVSGPTMNSQFSFWLPTLQPLADPYSRGNEARQGHPSCRAANTTSLISGWAALPSWAAAALGLFPSLSALTSRLAGPRPKADSFVLWSKSSCTRSKPHWPSCLIWKTSRKPGKKSSLC